MRWLTILALGALTACTHTASLYPSNEAATALGIPSLVYKGGMGSGPVTIQMPDGEVLTGRYALTGQGESMATAFSGGLSATAYGVSGGRPVVVGATDGKTTIQCDGAVNMGGGGGGECQVMPGGAVYRLVF